MRYKKDWEKSQKRWEAYWNGGELVDRCCCAVLSKEGNDMPFPSDPMEQKLWWTEPELIIKRNRDIMERTYYAGEAYPSIFVNLGAAGHAGFFKGSKYKFGNTVWFDPSIMYPDELGEFDKDSYLYKKTIELAKAFVEDSKGDYFVSMPDSTGNCDALSHLMGPNELLPTMLEEPDEVHSALEKIQKAYDSVMHEVYSIVKDVNHGGSCIPWMSTWAPGFHAQMQCDMSVMISNEMYEEFAMPELRAQCDMLEYPLYHFDGVEQIRHLDSLLSLDKLKAIQWMQVAGQKPCTEYIPELKKIQAAGKNLVIGVEPDQIQPLMENLSSKGLFMFTWAGSRDEADSILKTVEKLTHE